jgi:macrocin-O-methyltransferase TylF-like protien
MTSRLRSAVKIALVRFGARLPLRVHYHLNAWNNYLWVGAWMRTRGFQPVHVASSRGEVFQLIADEVGEAQLLYLEFGVSEGDSMRWWAGHHTNATSALHGFDSFRGLPSDWLLDRPAGSFSTGGTPPDLDDPRVQFHVGWFADTLPAFALPVHERLVVSLDADLYSSTVTVLDFLRDRLSDGTFLYFDEFNHRADELRAFEEFLTQTEHTFQLFAATRDFVHVAFEVVGSPPTA